MTTPGKPSRTSAAALPASRRRFLVHCAAITGWLLSPLTRAAEPTERVTIEGFSAAGISLGTSQVVRVLKSPQEWRAQLSADAFEVTRRGGTELPYTGAYLKNEADGLYRCVCCDTALFDSRAKFDSRTGWPSFWQAISANNVIEAADFSIGMQRTGVWCRRCEAHLGHVFADGPKPTGLRYCMNSVALVFVPRASPNPAPQQLQP